MFLKLIKQTWIPIVILGSITLGIFYITGAFNFTEMSIIHKEQYNIGSFTWNYYTIDLKLYLSNIENSIHTIPLTNESIPKIPQLPIWPTLSSNPVDYGTNILLVVKFIAQTLITGINFLIYTLNWILTPSKMWFYPIRIIITLLGLNTTQDDFVWLVNTISTAQIPYIPINF